MENLVGSGRAFCPLSILNRINRATESLSTSGRLSVEAYKTQRLLTILSRLFLWRTVPHYLRRPDHNG